MHYHWVQAAAKNKMNVTTLNSAHKVKKQCDLCGWLEQQHVGLHSFFCQPNSDLLGVGTKLK